MQWPASTWSFIHSTALRMSARLGALKSTVGRWQKLTPQQLEAMRGRIDSNMDALLPELTDRVSLYLKQKQQDFDLLTERLADEIALEGC